MVRRRTFLALLKALLLTLAGCVSSGGNDGQLGYSVGGAEDVNNFRDNVEEGYLPIATDLTYEGLYNQYYFDTGKGERCGELFCPSYARAVSRDPLSGEPDRYTTVGLNSGIDADEFERPDLNLVLVVDVSGSMTSPFASYYYDESGERVETERREKMATARDATHSLVDRLDPDDRFALVTFSDGANTVLPTARMDERDRTKIDRAIDGLQAGGGTNFDAGMREGTAAVEPYAEDEGRETRIVYVTDAMPNLGDTSSSGLGHRLEQNAEREIHTTFVGVGMDFNTAFVESVSAVRGANYYSIHSAAQFEERMGEGFEYMVTPLVFDLDLELESSAYEIDRVYGSPSADEATGELMHVNTLFPSRTEDGETKGGVVLLRLSKTGGGDELRLVASYEDRDGESHETVETVRFGDARPEHFENSGVRKAVLLSQYGDLLRSWVEYERASLADEEPETPTDGIGPHEERELGRWERQSTDLQVSPPYGERIAAFADHFEAEREALGDEELEQELDLMETILEHETGRESSNPRVQVNGIQH